MDNLSICKRIAEIENLMFDTGGRYARIEIWKNGKVFKYEKYNPLKDDALCFQLMVKYQINLNHYNDDNGKQMYWVCAHGVHDNNYKNPNKAICLAIIKANKLTLQKEGK